MELTSAEPSYVLEGIPGGESIVGDFVVGPGKVDVILKPGESKTIELLVTNRTGERRIFNLTTEDMTGSSDAMKPVVLLGDERGPYSLRDYLHVDHPSFELNHNQRARIPVTITIPPDAEPGGRYGSMLVDTVAIEAVTGDSESATPQSAIVARIGKKRLYASGPVPFGIHHTNTGSMHIAPYGELRIHNMFGEEIGFLELEPWFVLPQSERFREVRFDRELLIGRYTATVNINRSYDDIVDTASFSFYVLPWKVLLGAFAILFIVIFGIRTFFRTFEFSRKR
jgi:hypothetical protein